MDALACLALMALAWGLLRYVVAPLLGDTSETLFERLYWAVRDFLALALRQRNRSR